MRIKIFLCFTIAMGIVLPQTALALPTGFRHFEIRTSLAGDMDGLGLNLHGGETFNFLDIPLSPSTAPLDVLSEDEVFDTWVGGRRNSTVTWSQDGFENFQIWGAFAVIGSGGWGGVNGPPKLKIEGHKVGSFRVTDIENSYTFNVFKLRPSLYESLQQPTIDFSFSTPFDESSDWYDEGVLDFSAVFAFGRPDHRGPHRVAPAPVPEPATVLLLGSGLLGAVVFRRRSK